VTKKTRTIWILAGALAPAALLIASIREKPDLTGTWVLNLEKSRLQIETKIERGAFTIEHREPEFRFSRVFVVGGKEDAVSYALTTDGKEKVEQGSGRTATSRLYWDGDVLVLDERIVLKDGREATNVVHYSLQDGGKTLVAEEKFRGPIRKYDNHWVADLEKKGGDR
jgi:hypothetical protein